MTDKEIRINKYLSIAGIASRREAEELIKKNKIKINGKNATLGQKISLDDIVEIDGKKICSFPKKKYYLLNKPKKTICTLKDRFNRTLVTSLIDDNNYLFPVGRLDYDTTGVLIITNDGELANRLTHPSNQIKRIYRVRINESLSNKELLYLNSNNIYINNKKSNHIIEQVNKQSYLVTLTQGSYHHVKKIFELVNKKVLDLKRVEFAGLTCEKIPIGSYRELKKYEIKTLKNLVNLN